MRLQPQILIGHFLIDLRRSSGDPSADLGRHPNDVDIPTIVFGIISDRIGDIGEQLNFNNEEESVTGADIDEVLSTESSELRWRLRGQDC